MRRQQLPFVTGFTVKLSAQHPVYDICDSMAGDYPKTFVFDGWHPQCICYTTAKMLDKEEFRDFIKTGKIDQRKYTRSIPQNAQKYIEKHRDNFDNWKNKPDFIQQNFTADYNLRKSVLKHD